jgi:hypothetical protein
VLTWLQVVLGIFLMVTSLASSKRKKRFRMYDLRLKRYEVLRMPSSGVLHHVALVRIDIAQERISSIIRVTRISELGTTLAVTSNIAYLRSVLTCLVTANAFPSSPSLVTMMEAICSSETSVLTIVTWRNVPEDGILQNSECFLSFHSKVFGI